MFIDFLIETFVANAQSEAIVWADKTCNYGSLLERIDTCTRELREAGLARGSVVVVEADYSPNSVALLLALVELGAILVPLTVMVPARREKLLTLAQAEVVITIDDADRLHLERFDRDADHEIYGRLRADNHPGLVLFSSGSSGESKAVVHDFLPLLDKFKVPRRYLRTLIFLLFDHIGGLNTLLYVLANGGCLVTVADRSPDTVLAAVERYRVELLPTTPTYLNLVLLSEAYRRHDLRSLQMISYGTEPMQQSTLEQWHALFPSIELRQTYGLSELGILRSKSKSNDSRWVKVGGEGFQTRVMDGLLEIKAQSAMLGYLNAPDPYTADGWFQTGDAVEVDGEYMRFLGRVSEVINVGGQKVYPAEVEDVLQELENVAHVLVYGEKNPLLGEVVSARLQLRHPQAAGEVRSAVRRRCRECLDAYKVPVRVEVVGELAQSERFKKSRARSFR